MSGSLAIQILAPKSVVAAQAIPLRACLSQLLFFLLHSSLTNTKGSLATCADATKHQPQVFSACVTPLTSSTRPHVHLSLALIDLLLLVQISPPEIKDTPEAPKEAARRLEKMGGMTRDEKIMLGTMGLAVVLWVLGDAIGVSSVVAAMLGEWLLTLPLRTSLFVEASMSKLAL